MPYSSSQTLHPDVLIVDDNEDQCTSLRLLLESKGWSVLCALTSTQSISMVNDLKGPSIVLLDRNLYDDRKRPVLGENLLKELEWRARYPIVTCFYSGDTNPEAEIAAREAGAKEYIFKGDPPKLMLAKLGTAVSHLRLITEPNEDHLTGALNRRATYDRALRELSRAERGNTTTVCMVIDVDYLKRVNDAFGHEVGDRLLQSVVQSIHKHLRTTDIVCRYGADEFLVLLFEFKESNVDEFAREVWHTIRNQTIPVDQDDPRAAVVEVSASVGASVLYPEEIRNIKEPGGGYTDEALIALLQQHIKQADRKMYEAKARR